MLILTHWDEAAYADFVSSRTLLVFRIQGRGTSTTVALESFSVNSARGASVSTVLVAARSSFHRSRVTSPSSRNQEINEQSSAAVRSASQERCKSACCGGFGTL